MRKIIIHYSIYLPKFPAEFYAASLNYHGFLKRQKCFAAGVEAVFNSRRCKKNKSGNGSRKEREKKFFALLDQFGLLLSTPISIPSISTP